MGQSAIGMSYEELSEIAQVVPATIRVKQCSVCLWAGCECRKGSMLNQGWDHCTAYTYYD